ncbi:HlyD family secretion protein [Dyella sp. C9]|uniref:HlyD family secretion protein n=1 Tax=Dyella sp. C9 TaxID=2202154 RepID=UPI001E3887FB|nr:HlyD family efflux transporter periplasmic adaptor subunit [Dyella sp. C9]
MAAPLSRWVHSSLVAALSGSLLLFLWMGQYTRREAVTGQLVPSTGLLTLTAPSSGTVTQLHVQDGHTVKRGDVLLELSTEQDSSALGQTHAVVSEALETQRQRLHSDLVNQATVTQQQGEALRTKASLLRAQREQIEQQLALQQQQVASNQSLLDRIQPLAGKGYVSVFQIEQQRVALLEARAQYKTLIRQQLDTQQQLEATQEQLAQLPLDDANKRNDTERQLASVTQSLAENEIGRAIVLRAPSDGIVATVFLKPGQTASAGQSLVAIVPAGAVLQAQLLVPSRAVGFIEPGHRVVLRYQAFPYQKFGQQYGRVIDISRSALAPAEVSALIGQSSQEPLYRVHVALDRQEVMAYGKPEPIKPGMALDADILMERRRLIEWVFEPLYGFGHRLNGGTAHD